MSRLTVHKCAVALRIPYRPAKAAGPPNVKIGNLHLLSDLY